MQQSVHLFAVFSICLQFKSKLNNQFFFFAAIKIIFIGCTLKDKCCHYSLILVVNLDFCIARHFI